MSLQRVIEDVENEREHQEERWGVANDDCNTLADWLSYIQRYASLASDSNDRAAVRHRLIQMAALAVAAAESSDRNLGHPRSDASLPTRTESKGVNCA
jgi:hypothetical protein